MMDTLIEQVDEFVQIMKEKGYDGAFLTNSGFPGSLKQSIYGYLYASLLGTENGLKDGFSILTSLKYEGEDQPRAEAYFKVMYDGRTLNINKMTTNLVDRYGKLIKSNTELTWETNRVPSKAQAIAEIYSEKRQQVIHKNTLKP